MAGDEVEDRDGNKHFLFYFIFKDDSDGSLESRWNVNKTGAEEGSLVTEKEV